MYRRRRTTISSSNNNSNNNGNGQDHDDCSSTGTKHIKTTTCTSTTTSRLFRPSVKIIVVQRAPLMTGLSCPNTTTMSSSSSSSSSKLYKKFQRPSLKRRAYNKDSDHALRCSSLGPKRRMDGMAKLLARAGRGLAYKLTSSSSDDNNNNNNNNSDSDDSDDEDTTTTKEPDRPFEPLRVWQSPHQGGQAKGLPPTSVMEKVEDEFGVEEMVRVLKPAPHQHYSKHDVFVPPLLAKWLRPHQREGVKFMYECVMGLKDFKGYGCILADDMGLGKTLQSVCLIYTLLKTGITVDGAPTAKRVIVACPCSLVKNWENEFVKWLGPGVVKTLAIAEADRATVEKNLDCFVKTKLFNVLIASYECIRGHVKRLNKVKDCCDLLVCDEAHRLKNRENQTSRALDSLPVKRRVLLTGTPMQNDLLEFFAMVDFTNAGVLGSLEDFRKYMLAPILRGREPGASDAEKKKMVELQVEMSSTVNDFILRRVNTLNAQHLPPKLVQVVCCNLTPTQQQMYQHLVEAKELQHIQDGKQVNCLGSIQTLMKLCNHPSLVVNDDDTGTSMNGSRRATSKKIKYTDDGDKETADTPGASGLAKYLPDGGGGGRNAPVYPEWSGKMFVLYRLMKEMRKPRNGADKIVIVSNYTQTLDLIGRMCRENSWRFCRLDGSVGMKKRQKMVEEFNDPTSTLIAFLLSSKAGGCGLNLIGGNRLVLFDPDWNPAVDKQAAARCWRDGQKKRCFTYRFMATGTVEEKIFQRQLSKEGLQSVVDDKEQVNALSTKDLRNLFKLRTGTPSDTHDKLRCTRCEIIHDTAEMEEAKVLPKKLELCKALLDRMVKEETAVDFLVPMDATKYNTTKEDYESLVKQPMDLGTIQKKLNQSLELQQSKKEENEDSEQVPEQSIAAVGEKSTKRPKKIPVVATYNSVSAFSKDVYRVINNCLKVWDPPTPVAEAACQLRTWWQSEWTELTHQLARLKSDDGDAHDTNKADHEIISSAAASKRGDNYEEQIGMPEEEDMRSWSHHHSTQTVDDPVFRAAMQGYDDIVSFVFGLEVTWSLIQERQQQEEEQQALLELQAIDELEEEEEADDEEDESDEDCNVKNESKEDSGKEEAGGCALDIKAEDAESSSSNEDGDDTSEKSDSDDDGDDEQEMAASEVDAQVATTEESEISDDEDDDDDDDDDDDENNHEVEIQSATSSNVLEAEIATQDDDEVMAAVTADSSPEDKENTEPTNPNSWTCQTCTLVNSNRKAKCGACEQPRPKKRRR